jgi:bifunctional non-homologous end joining protein LigD
MGKPLSTYLVKRDLHKTPEPAAKVVKREGKKKIFVIQKHSAKSLHYDFRLEADFKVQGKK